MPGQNGQESETCAVIVHMRWIYLICVLCFIQEYFTPVTAVGIGGLKEIGQVSWYRYLYERA